VHASIGLLLSVTLLSHGTLTPDGDLRSMLSRGRFDQEEVKAAIDTAIEEAKIESLTELCDGYIAVAPELLQNAERTSGAKVVVESMAKAQGADEDEIADLNKKLMIFGANVEVLKLVCDEIERGLRGLFPVVAENGDAAAFDGLQKLYEEASRRRTDASAALLDKNADWSEVVYKLDNFRGTDPTQFQAREAELKAGSECLRREVAMYEMIREQSENSVSAILGRVDPKAKERLVADVAARTGRKGDLPERVLYTGLFASLGLPSAPEDLLETAKKAGREFDAQEADLEKLRKQYYSTVDAYFGMLENSNGMIRVDLEAAFNTLTKQVQEASAAKSAQDKLLRESLLSFGIAASSVQAAERDKTVKAVIPLIGKEKDVENRCLLIESLGRCDTVDSRAFLRQSLATDKETRCLIAALNGLVLLGDGECLASVRTLLGNESWRVRVAAVRTLASIRHADNLPLLIDVLKKPDGGRLVEDAAAALQWLTGEGHGNDAAKWQEWWTANSATFDFSKVFGRRDVILPRTIKPESGKVGFYGISTDSRRIVFLIDVSGSMKDPVSGRGDKTKLEVAKEELKKAVLQFKDGATFNIATVGNLVTWWQPKPAKASASIKDRAAKWIDESIQPALSSSNLYSGLMEVLDVCGAGISGFKGEPPIDTIYFLADGDPTIGETLDTEEIRRQVRERNRYSLVRLHTVGIGEKANAKFLYGLAEDSGGSFVVRR